MIKMLRWTCLILLFALFSGQSFAETETVETTSPEPTAVAVSEDGAGEEGAEAEVEPEVTLYMTSWCGFCRKTERLLESLDVTYKAIDIEKEAGARAEKQRLQPRCGVPVTLIGEESVCGFSEPKIRQLIDKLKSKQKSEAGEVAEG